MQRRLRLALAAGMLLILGGCAPLPQASQAAPASQQLTVLAAASLKEAFETIGADFEAAHPGADVLFSFAGSQQLVQQISEGAPADIFASADTQQMQNAVASGRIDPSAPQVFARNSLVVVFPQDNPKSITGLHDLAKPGVKIVLADDAVPAGRYARQVLANASQSPDYTQAFSATVLSNVVSFEENVRSVLNKVALGEADAGIVYLTDAKSAASDSIGMVAIPDDLNVIATYPIAALQDSAQPALVKAFVGMVLSEPGQRTMIDFGFQPAIE